MKQLETSVTLLGAEYPVTVVFDDEFDDRGWSWRMRALAEIAEQRHVGFPYDDEFVHGDQVEYVYSASFPLTVGVNPFNPISYGYGNRENPNFQAWCAHRAG